jgi:hypothetical protein
MTAVGWLACSAMAAEKLGLKKGDVELKSVGPLAFGPDGVLFIGDPKAAAVIAVDTGDTPGKKPVAAVEIENLEKEVAQAAGVDAGQARVSDLAVNPQNGVIYIAIAAEGKPPVIARIAEGGCQPVALKGVAMARAELPQPPEDRLTGEGRRQRNPRNESITDLAFVDGQVIVSGLKAGETASSVQAIPFPFGKNTSVTGLEIFHGAHGRVEDYAPIRVFVPFNINGEPHLLAGFTCTPLVKFPVKQLDGSEKVRGTTVAELGNRNQPLDMIAYEQDGEVFLLMANSARGVMKISTSDIERDAGIEAKIDDTAGQPYETIEGLKGVIQLDKLDDTRAVVLEQSEGGSLTLRTIPLP